MTVHSVVCVSTGPANVTQATVDSIVHFWNAQTNVTDTVTAPTALATVVKVGPVTLVKFQLAPATATITESVLMASATADQDFQAKIAR